jgi:hypothetical protein
MADVSGKFYSATKVRTGVSPSSPGIEQGATLEPVNPPGSAINSVGLTMPTAFNVANSPLTSNGTISVTGAGTTAEYIRGDGTLASFPSLTGYVPYTGATQNVDLGEFGLDTGFVNLDTTPTNTPTTQGTMYWDDSHSTAALIMNGTLQHIGQDTFFYVKNASGSSIAKGTAVRFDGTDGASGHLLIAPFLANGTYPSTYFMGVTAETIGNGSFGQVMHFGELSGINTSGYTAGALLYASTTVAGGFQTTAPVAPNNIVLIAAAINSKNNGDILVRPTYGSNINQDEGVKIVSPTTGQLLQLQSNGLWENKTKAQVLGGTSSQFVKGDGSLDSTTYQSTADKGQPNGYASLDSNGKVPLTQINDALIGNVNYQGLWNASTNTPTLANPPSSGTKGYYYIVSTAGTFAGISFEVGDWIISSGSAWQKIDNTDAVSSVFGRTGNVVAANGDYTTAQVTESGNLYYTDGRARAALSFAAGSGAYNTSTGVITIPTNNNQITNGAGYITSAGTITGASGALTSRDNRTISPSEDNAGQLKFGFTSWANNDGAPYADYLHLRSYTDNSGGNDNLVMFLKSGIGMRIYQQSFGSASAYSSFKDIAFTDGTNASGTWGINITGNAGTVTNGVYTSRTITINGTTQDLSANRTFNVGTVTSVTASSPLFSSGGTTPNITIQQASGSQNGFLSSTDWTTFNNKQNALTNPVTGTGTTNYLPKFTGSTTIGNSNLINDSSGNLGLGVTPSAWSVYRAFQLGTGIAVGGLMGRTDGVNEINFGLNWTYTGGASLTYIASSFATNYYQKEGTHIWQTAPSGTAGNAITFAQSMTLFSSGNLAVGTTSDAGFKLDVNGTGRFSGNLSLNTSSLILGLGNGGSNEAVYFNYNSNAASRSWRIIKDWTAFGDFQIQQSTTQTGTTYADILRFTSTGAATFSSSVTATQGNFTSTANTYAGASIILRAIGGTNPISLTSSSGFFALSNGGSADHLLISSTGATTIGNLAGSGNRIVVANSGGTLISAVIGSGLAFDGTTLTATGGSSGSISGSGTSGTIALFTGTSSIGNSVITQSGTQIGINNTSPLNTAWGNDTNTKQLSINGSNYAVINLEGSTGRKYSMGAGDGNFYMCYDNTAARHNLTVSAAGNVTINGTSDNGNRLQVNGTIWSNSSVTATSFFESSDSTLKTLVQDDYQAKGIDSVVAKLYIKNGKQELGYFAQDLEGVLPSAVSKGSDGLLNLSYREVHTAKIAYLEEEIRQIKKRYEIN